MKKRASAVIIKDNKILLIRRVKPSGEYWTLPGGTVEEGESFEEAMIREVKEEMSLASAIDRNLFEITDKGREERFFLVKLFEGEPQLGGPELERMNETNQYHLEWIHKEAFKDLEEFYPNPTGAQEKLVELWEDNKL